MKPKALLVSLSLLFALVGVAQEPVSGYTVMVDLLVGESGQVEEAKVKSSEADILNQIAIRTAKGFKLAPRQENGAPVKYRIVAPLSFPVEGDGGSEAQARALLPKPRLQPPAAFPYKLSQTGTTGGVILEIQVNREGGVGEVKVVRASDPAFEKVAIDAVKRWRYVPAKVAGKSVETRFYQAMVFEIEGREKPDWKWYVAPRPCQEFFASIMSR